MEIYRTAYPNELYHHGILGQKWGKKNGPPYPLDYSDHSATEKKHLTRYQKKFAKASDKYESDSNYSKNRDALQKMKKYASKDKELNEYAESIKGKAAASKVEMDLRSGNYSDKEAAKIIGSINYYKLKEMLSDDYADNADLKEVTQKTKEYITEKFGDRIPVLSSNGGSQRYHAALSIIDMAADKALPEDYAETKKKVEARLIEKIKFVNDKRNKLSKEFENEDILATDHKVIDNPKNAKRVKEAADLGLKALHKMGMDAYYGYNKGQDFDDDDRDWFIWEDQTIGLHAIADLVNRGKSKAQILEIIDKANDIVNLDLYGDDDTYIPGSFELAENHFNRTGEFDNSSISKFIDACISIKKGK